MLMRVIDGDEDVEAAEETESTIYITSFCYPSCWRRLSHRLSQPGATHLKHTFT